MKHGPRTILLKLLTILLSGSPYQWWTRQQGTAGLIPQQSQLRRLTLHVQLLSRATSALTVELGGINQFQMFATVNTKKFPRGISDSVISNPEARTAAGTCTGSGPQATSFKLQAAGHKQQASSHKPLSHKHRLQATSHKRQAP